MKVDARWLDYGAIKKGDDRIREFKVTNVSSDTVLVLKMAVPSAEYSVRFSTKKIAPQESGLVRVKYNPKKKGSFSDVLTLHFSDMSSQIKAKGKVDYLEWEDFTPCPDFDKPKGDRSTDFDVHFKVIDKDSREPIANADIFLAGRAKGNLELKTNRKGEVVTRVPIDFYDISAKSAGYGRYNMESYINRRNKNFTLELYKGEMSGTIVVRPDRPVKEVEKEDEEVAEIEIEVREEPEEVAEEVSIEPEPKEVPSEFSANEYKANNVVFLIDVSTSMRKEDRLDILKSSMIELTKMLRPTDVLTIITYASNTDVVISGEHVDDPERIIKVIEELEGKGLTAGEAGVKKAYTLAKRHRIDGGNNQVYLATDGAFNKGGDKIARLVRQEARRGTNMSVLAIRSSKWSRDKMEGIAKAGKGSYLMIDDFEAASNELKALIKRQAAIKK